MRREDATHGAGQGLSAQMSEGMPRLALAKYLSKHIMGIACAHVRETGWQGGRVAGRKGRRDRGVLS